MELDIWLVAALCCAYFLAGFIDSIAGGGGLISIPAFLLTGTPAELVLGTNKLAVSLGSAASLLVYIRSGNVMWRIALFGLPMALLGTALGAKVILLVDSTTIARIVIFFLPLIVAVTLLPKRDVSKTTLLSPTILYVALPLVCLLVGFYDGFLGIGSGTFFLLAFHFVVRAGLISASATTKIFSLCSSAIGFAVFAMHGKVLFLLALPLAASNIAGNVVGSNVALLIGASFVKKVLTFSLLLLFSSLTWKFYF